MICRAIILSVLASPVLADCPVAADLDKGVRLTMGDGTVEVYRSRGSGVIEVTSEYPDNYTALTLLGQGIYVLELADIVDGRIDPDTRSTFAFPMRADEMPLPTAGGQWTVKTAVRDSYGTYAETVAMKWGEETQVNYGGCTYTMIPGEWAYSSEEYDHQETIHYLPEVGIGVLYSYDDAELDAPDVFEVVDIAVDSQ